MHLQCERGDFEQSSAIFVRGAGSGIGIGIGSQGNMWIQPPANDAVLTSGYRYNSLVQPNVQWVA